MTTPGNHSGAPPAEAAPWERWPTIAYVETDRYCEHCGYNLRTQAVRRDPQTQILLTRCPECGRLHAAADTTGVTKLWLRRFALLLLVTWMGLIAVGCLGTLALEATIIGATLDDFTTYDYSDRRSSGNTYVPPRLIVKSFDWRPHYPTQVLGFCGAAAALLGFITVFVAVVVFPHWRRGFYLFPVLAGPALVAGLALFFWRMNVLEAKAPELVGWSLPYIGGYMLMEMLGGLTALFCGRPLARGLVRMLLPSRLRAPFAYLWLADGKSPPGVAA